MCSMSTVAEIQNAIELLPAPDREALELQLLARRFGLDALGEDEGAKLLASLDVAESEMDGGQFHSGDELREAVRKCATRS